ncbi:MAG TPA: phosphodiester glycosidase family protein [Firmicutes bacterium]|nr:phosphodiester glycosidase family protein [Bacillota bacterium]
MAAAFPRRRIIWRMMMVMLLFGMMSKGISFAQSPEDVDNILPVEHDSLSADRDLPPEDPLLPTEDQAAEEEQETETAQPTEADRLPVTGDILVSVELIKEQERIGLRIISEKPSPYRIKMSAAATRLIVDLPAMTHNSELPQYISAGVDGVLRSLETSPLGEEGTQVALTLAYAVPDWSDTGWVRIDGGLYKLVVAAQRRFVQHREFVLQQSVTLIMQNRGEVSGPISVRALRFSPHDSQTRLGLGLAEGAAMGLEPVPAIVRRYGAYAGVNAAYFHASGLSLGLLVNEYTLVSTPVYDRTALLMLSDGSIGMDRAALQAYVHLADETQVAVHGFNRIRKAGEVVVYNSAFGSHTPKDTQVRELIIEKGAVVAIGHGNTPIGPGTTVIAHDSQSLLILAQPGERAFVTWDLRLLGYQTIIPGYMVRLAVSGGPRLVADGQVFITSADEQFRSDVTQGRAPRTAIGITADYQILLVTVDGRQLNHSIGMTLEELAHLMIELGAVQAMNLDGGGSTTMVVDDVVVNRPSNGSARAVSSALLVYTRGIAMPQDDRTLSMESAY